MRATRQVRLAAITIAALLLSSASAAQAQPSPSARESYSRIIARADAIILGRVLDAGDRDVPVPGTGGQIVTKQGFARIAVQRWIVGPDEDSILDIRSNPGNPAIEMLQREGPQSPHSVILYLLRSRGTWVIVHDLAGGSDIPRYGIEVLSLGEALQRVPAILQEATAATPDSMAARADLAAVCSLDRFTDNPPGMIGHVERVLFGTLTDSVLCVVTTTPSDLRRGRALLLLKERPDSTWEVLDDGAGSYYLYHDRVAHSPAPLEAVFNRLTAAHARRARGPAR
jgi:hypothetical protein